MKLLSNMVRASAALVFAFGAMSSGAQAAVMGNLNDGLDHVSSSTGYWSLFVNAGDVVTVTARRIDPVDIIANAFNGAAGSGDMVGYGDDDLPPNTGGPYGDPQFSFTALTSGEYSVGVFRYASGGTEAINYFVNARGATGNNGTVPIPGTLALVGLGLAGLGYSRKKSAYAANA